MEPLCACSPRPPPRKDNKVECTSEGSQTLDFNGLIFSPLLLSI